MLSFSCLGAIINEKNKDISIFFVLFVKKFPKIRINSNILLQKSSKILCKKHNIPIFMGIFNYLLELPNKKCKYFVNLDINKQINIMIQNWWGVFFFTDFIILFFLKA